MASVKLEGEHKTSLLALAEASIAHGAALGASFPVDLDQLDPVLHKSAASFVTLYCKERLAGCIGTLSATQSLAENVARNAFLAAFSDQRFEPLALSQLESLGIEISVLSQLNPIVTDSEEMLFQQIRPGEHGLVLEYGSQRATFLPKVWSQLPEPEIFLAHLKQKAGLPVEFWSSELRFSLYSADSFRNF
ncbi:MAG: AmmeMemoRadiSam system protein A [Pseudomonadales bacterium]